MLGLERIGQNEGNADAYQIAKAVVDRKVYFLPKRKWKNCVTS